VQKNASKGFSMTLLGVLLASGVPWQQGLLPALVIELVCCLIELGMKHQSTHDHGIQTLQQRPDPSVANW
jgi:hypothetical protein